MRAIRSLAVCALAASLAPASGHAWTRSYVVEKFEPALYYQGPSNGSPQGAGPDCANGVENMDLRKAFTTSFRTPERINHLMSAEATTRDFNQTLGFRGPNRELVYENPTILPDTQTVESTSKVAEGFDLDDNPATGFVGVDGTPGVDNEYYRVAGCSFRFRALPWQSAAFDLRRAQMQAGKFAIVMVVSGHKDPMNDDDVTIGFYASQDAIVKDAHDVPAADYTFRISADPRFQNVMKGKIAGGVLETVGRPTLNIHDMEGDPTPTLELTKIKLRFTTRSDGYMEGFVGGYRDWFQQFVVNFPAWNFQQGGAYEKLGHSDSVGHYYALRRRADGVPDAQGRMTAISMTYRFQLAPAFVTTPNGDAQVQVAQVFAEK